MEDAEISRKANETADERTQKPDKEPIYAAGPIFFATGIALAIFTGLMGIPDEELGIPLLVAVFVPAGFVYWMKKREWDEYYRQRTDIYTREFERLKSRTETR